MASTLLFHFPFEKSKRFNREIPKNHWEIQINFTQNVYIKLSSPRVWRTALLLFHFSFDLLLPLPLHLFNFWRHPCCYCKEEDGSQMKKEIKNKWMEKQTNEWTNEGTNELTNEQTIMMKESYSYPHIATDEERRKVIKASAPNPSSISITRGWRESRTTNKYKIISITNTNSESNTNSILQIQNDKKYKSQLHFYCKGVEWNNKHCNVSSQLYSSTKFLNKYVSTNISQQIFLHKHVSPP